jgi:hypothetical protein
LREDRRAIRNSDQEQQLCVEKELHLRLT